MRLGQLIDALKMSPQENVLLVSGPTSLGPTSVNSYRGYYEDLAIAVEEGARPKVCDFVRVLEQAIGKTFQGYKGGDYTMDKGTLVWVSNYGRASGCVVDRVDNDDTTTYLVGRMDWARR